jgi:hypothetical protein
VWREVLAPINYEFAMLRACREQPEIDFYTPPTSPLITNLLTDWEVREKLGERERFFL